MTLKNNRAPLLSNIKLYISFRHHMWIQTGVTVRKRLSWVVTSVALTFDLWPWPFAWTLPWSVVITPENFMMIWWWEHSQKVWRTDGQTDRQTENTIHRAAWSQLKKYLVDMLGQLQLLYLAPATSTFKWGQPNPVTTYVKYVFYSECTDLVPVKCTSSCEVENKFVSVRPVIVEHIIRMRYWW